jgi:hypothetical protein
LFCFLLSACGKGEEEAMAPSKSSGMAGGDKGGMMEESGMMAHGKTVDGTFYPDHEMDSKEFQVRSSLAGVKRMIKDYEENGYDTSDLEKRKAQLEKELDKLTG